MKWIALGTEVIRRLLMEETSILTLTPARGQRRASLNDHTLLRRRCAGTSEAARVPKRGESLDRIRRLRAQGSVSGESNRSSHSFTNTLDRKVAGASVWTVMYMGSKDARGFNRSRANQPNHERG